MPQVTPPPRLHIISARDEPIAVVLRRGPSKWCNVLLYHSDKDVVESGSWFHGRIYEHRCDLSPDGRHFVYLAMGKGETWNGICIPPRLTCIVQWQTLGAWFGGGVWRGIDKLDVNLGAGTGFDCGSPFRPEHPTVERPDITFSEMTSRFGGEDEGILYERLERDGWVRQGPFGQNIELPGNQYNVAHKGDSGWLMHAEGIPDVRMYYRGYFSGKGRHYEFTMPDYPSIITPEVNWVTVDNRKNLLIARKGHLERWACNDFERGEPAFSIDLSQISPPVSEHKED